MKVYQCVRACVCVCVCVFEGIYTYNASCKYPFGWVELCPLFTQTECSPNNVSGVSKT